MANYYLKEIRTEIEINASAERVWKILSDFSKYDQWNPFIRRIVGEANPGSKIEIHIETPGGKKRKYEPTVLKADPEKELRWLGKSSLPGMLKGEHIFTIETIQPRRVKFVQSEIFDGLLASFFGKSLDEDVKKGFEQMNSALKKMAEGSSL